MNLRTGILQASTSAILLAALLTPRAAADETPFDLPAAIPGDVFLCLAQRPNPEREFLDAHWAQVWAAFQDSGITEDVFETLSSLMSEDERAEVDRLMERVTTLVEGVDWNQLGAVEFAFGQRMPEEMNLQTGMTPEMVWLFRGSPEGSAECFDGLLAILDGLVEEVNHLGGGELLAVEHGERMGARLATLGSPMAPELPISIDVGLAGDVVVIGFGKTILGETLALLAGESDHPSKAADPRFAAALTSMGKAEDSITFFDMQAMLGDMRGMVDGILEETGAGPSARLTNAYLNPEANQLMADANAAYQAGDYATALETIRLAHEVAPTDCVAMYNLACFNALNGNQDEALDWLDQAVVGGFNDPGKIRSDSDLDSLRDDARYDAALAKAEAVVGGGADEWLEQVNRIADRIQGVPGMIDYVVGLEYTEGYSTHAETVTAMVPDAASMPFYPVIAGRAPLAEFARYLPVETTSFSVSNGMDLGALYTFVEDTVRLVGPEGEQLLAQWEALQEEWELDMQRDVFGWVEGQTVTVTLGEGMSAQEVMMVKVTDEDLAREKISQGIEFMGVLAEQMVAEAGNPMLAMIVPRTAPLEHERLEGFQTLTVASQPMIWGVTDGHLIVGSGAAPVVLCLDTALGNHPNVQENQDLMGKLLLPDEAFSTLSYADERGLGETGAAILGGLSMGMGMAPMFLPEGPERVLVARAAEIIRKLAPVVAEIDFYLATSTHTTFDGQAWRSHSVTYYRPPIGEQEGEAR